MSAWGTFIAEVQEHVRRLDDSGCDCPLFRGHTSSDWKLLCGLGRRPNHLPKKPIESVLYYDFISQAGPLLERPDSSWDVLFTMQHHGLPTRLLDWSGTFGVALYFALKPLLLRSSAPVATLPAVPPSIWILDPFELNQQKAGEGAIFNPEIDLEGTYQEIFIEESKSLGATVMAVNPTQNGRRIGAQRGYFTLHADLSSPLEARSPSFLRQFQIPIDALADAIAFLQLAGMNEFALFPDLDGLGRHLRDRHVDWA